MNIPVFSKFTYEHFNLQAHGLPSFIGGLTYGFCMCQLLASEKTKGHFLYFVSKNLTSSCFLLSSWTLLYSVIFLFMYLFVCLFVTFFAFFPLLEKYSQRMRSLRVMCAFLFEL